MTADKLTYFVFAGAVGVMCLIPAPVFTLRAMELGGSRKTRESGRPNIIIRALPKVSIAIMGLLGYEYATASIASGVAYFVGLAVSAVVYGLVNEGHKKLGAWTCMCSLTDQGIIL